jgi:hypothetical protein
VDKPENTLEGWTDIIQEQGRRMRGEVDTLDDSGPVPTSHEVEEMNAPGEYLEGESPVDRCARGEHEQMESEPWRCVYSESHVDHNPPNTSRLILVLAPWLVAERETHNWILKVRKKVESGAHAGQYRWDDVGYHPTPGFAAQRAYHLMVEQDLHQQGPGVLLKDAIPVMLRIEEELRRKVEPVAAALAREKALREALDVVKDEKDRERIEKLLKPK